MYNNWEDLERSIVGCKKCRLCDNRNNIVFGEGNKQAKLMFVGEGPGADEDRLGQPFVGKAGQLMNKALDVYKRQVYTLKYSDFEVLGHEIEFNKGKQYEPIVLELNNGKKVEITGKIDRVDIAKTTDGNYIRIIDYKSSIKNIDLNEVVAGLQLQLLTYLDATCKIENMLPAGVLYFNLIDPIINSNKNLSEDQIDVYKRQELHYSCCQTNCLLEVFLDLQQ